MRYLYSSLYFLIKPDLVYVSSTQLSNSLTKIIFKESNKIVAKVKSRGMMSLLIWLEYGESNKYKEFSYLANTNSLKNVLTIKFSIKCLVKYW